MNLRRFSACRFVLGGERQPRELGHALDQLGDLFPEHPRDLLASDIGVLDDVVQQRR